MINTLTRATKACDRRCCRGVIRNRSTALAQAPSQAQRDAIKSQCRSDYMAHCSSVPPGGEASLQCLQKNMSSLSSSCQTRGARGGSAGGCHRQSRDCHTARLPNGRRLRRTAAARNAARRKLPSQSCEPLAPAATADQRADFRHPQRLPLRLSEGLRGRADRRRAGAAMPGKEQGETLGRLREGRLRRRRRCATAAAPRQARLPPQRLQRLRRRGAGGHRAAADAAA